MNINYKKKYIKYKHKYLSLKQRGGIGNNSVVINGSFTCLMPSYLFPNYVTKIAKNDSIAKENFDRETNRELITKLTLIDPEQKYFVYPKLDHLEYAKICKEADLPLSKEAILRLTEAGMPGIYSTGQINFYSMIKLEPFPSSSYNLNKDQLEHLGCAIKMLHEAGIAHLDLNTRNNVMLGPNLNEYPGLSPKDKESKRLIKMPRIIDFGQFRWLKDGAIDFEDDIEIFRDAEYLKKKDWDGYRSFTEKAIPVMERKVAKTSIFDTDDEDMVKIRTPKMSLFSAKDDDIDMTKRTLF